MDVLVFLGGGDAFQRIGRFSTQGMCGPHLCPILFIFMQFSVENVANYSLVPNFGDGALVPVCKSCNPPGL